LREKKWKSLKIFYGTQTGTAKVSWLMYLYCKNLFIEVFSQNLTRELYFWIVSLRGLPWLPEGWPKNNSPIRSHSHKSFIATIQDLKIVIFSSRFFLRSLQRRLPKMRHWDRLIVKWLIWKHVIPMIRSLTR
jgi:hypothetical protein